MDRQNNFPLQGLFRNEIVFVRDYRKRAFWIGVFQLVMAICYLLAALLFNKFMSIMSSAVNREYLSITGYENQKPINLSIDVHDRGLDTAFSEVYFWMTLNNIRAVLHTLSSFLIIWATSENTAISRAIRSACLASLLNLAFLVYEIVVLVLMYQEWQFAFLFVLYRVWFNHEVLGLMKQLKMLSPPPPGHGHQE